MEKEIKLGHREEIINADNWRCPQCGEEWSEEDMMDACQEPFNGIIVECPECKAEFSVDILFKTFRNK